MTGLLAGNTMVTVLWRSMLVMLACYIVGRIVGSIAQRTIEDYIRRYKSLHPVPAEAQDSEDRSLGGTTPRETATTSG